MSKLELPPPPLPPPPKILKNKHKRVLLVVSLVAILVPGIFLGAILFSSRPVDDSSVKPPTEFKMGLHIQAYTIFNYGWSGSQDIDWKSTVSQNMLWFSRKGYNCILLDTMDAYNGTYYFKCDLLKTKGYTPTTEVLDTIVEEAHRKNITIYGDITVLAWRLSDSQTEKYQIAGQKLSIQEVQQVAAQLLEDCNFDGLIAEGYPVSYAEGIANEVHKHPDKIWIHKFDDPSNSADVFMAEDYVGFISSQTHLQNVIPGALGGGLGSNNAVYSHAKAYGKPGWTKVTTEEYDLPLGASHNVLLLRAAEFGAEGYFWMPKTENTRKLVANNNPAVDPAKLIPLLEHLQKPQEQKKVANLVISLPWHGSSGKFSDAQAEETCFAFMVNAFGPVSNGLMLAGYDIQTTYNSVLTDADVYVVLAIGEVEGIVVDPFPELETLLQSEKPAVFVVWGLTDKGNWKGIPSQFGISSNWQYSATKGEIGNVVFKGKTVPWSPIPLLGYSIQTSTIPLNQVESGTVLLSTTGTEPTALIIQKGGRYLINANAFHIQSSFIFSQLFSPSLKEPFYGVGSLGNQSCFMAMQDTAIVIDLPLQNGATVHQVLFGSDGVIAEDKTVTLTNHLNVQLKQYELLVIEPA